MIHVIRFIVGFLIGYGALKLIYSAMGVFG